MPECDEIIGPFQVHLNTDTSTVRRIYLSNWLAAVGVDSIKLVLKICNADAGFRGQILLQTAEVRPDAPGAPVTLGSAVTGNDEMCTGVVDVSSTLTDKSWFRLGVAYDLASGTDAQADVELTAAFLRCGKVLGSVSQTLVATSTTTLRMPVSGWLPAMTAGKVDLAAVTSGLSGAFQWKLVWAMTLVSAMGPIVWV